MQTTLAFQRQQWSEIFMLVGTLCSLMRTSPTHYVLATPGNYKECGKCRLLWPLKGNIRIACIMQVCHLEITWVACGKTTYPKTDSKDWQSCLQSMDTIMNKSTVWPWGAPLCCIVYWHKKQHIYIHEDKVCILLCFSHLYGLLFPSVSELQWIKQWC